MELKMKYHYSYFIYPYVIKKMNYNKYIQGLLKNKKIKPKFFQREKNPEIYKFFLPSIRKYMFSSFDIAESFFDIETKGYDNKLRTNAFKAGDCLMFDYDVGINAQAKVEDDSRHIL